MSTWVLLRGLMRESRHWGAFPELLRSELPDAHVVTLDLPGNGSLHRMRSPASVAAMVAACRLVLSERALAPPYYLLAISMGGMVGVAWERMHPQEIAGAVLISTSMRPHNPFYQRLRPRNYAALIGMALRLRNPRREEALILRLTSCRGDQQPQVLDAWAGYAQQSPVSRANALRQLLAAARFSDQGGVRKGRFLLLAGAQDRLVDPACSAALARAWGADLVIQPEAGHDLPLDDGPWVAAQVRVWLEQRANNAGA